MNLFSKFMANALRLVWRKKSINNRSDGQRCDFVTVISQQKKSEIVKVDQNLIVELQEEKILFSLHLFFQQFTMNQFFVERRHGQIYQVPYSDQYWLLVIMTSDRESSALQSEKSFDLTT